MSATTKPNVYSGRSPGVLSRITRRWNLILGLWVLISAPIIYLIYCFVQPTYEAFSSLRVTPSERALFESSSSDADSRREISYLQTQVSLILSDRVLGPVIASREVANLSTITEPDDPRADLRNRMTVEIVKGAQLIRVGLELPDGNQAATIVNAVVHSYLAYNGEHAQSASATLRYSLTRQLEKYREAITEKRAELKVLYQKSRVDVLAGSNSLNDSANASDPTQSPLAMVTEAQAERIRDELINTDLELIKAQSILDTAQAANKPETDPVARQKLSELRLNVASLLKRRENQVKYFKGLKVRKNGQGNTASDAAFLNRQLEVLLTKEDRLKQHLEQLDFDASREDYRITTVDDAKAPKVPTNIDRLRYMAVAPVAVLTALLALALLSPIKDEHDWTEV